MALVVLLATSMSQGFSLLSSPSTELPRLSGLNSNPYQQHVSNQTSLSLRYCHWEIDFTTIFLLHIEKLNVFPACEVEALATPKQV